MKATKRAEHHEEKTTKEKTRKNKTWIWVVLLLLFDSSLINFAISKNYEGNLAKTPISYAISKENLLSKITIFFSHLLESNPQSIMLIRICLTALSLITLLAMLNFAKAIGGKKISFFTALLYALSPPHLYFSSTINPLAILLPLFLGGISLFFTTRILGKGIGTLMLIIASVLSYPSFIITILLFGYNIIKSRKFRKTKIFLSIIFTLLVLSLNFFTHIAYVVPEYNFSNILKVAFEFGNLFGIFVTVWIYGIIGMFLWRVKEHKKMLLILLLVTFLMLHQSLYNITFLNIIITIFAGISIKELLIREWEIPTARIITTVAIFSVLLLSDFSFFFILPQITYEDSIIKEAHAILSIYPIKSISTHPFYFPVLKYVEEENKKEEKENTKLNDKNKKSKTLTEELIFNSSPSLSQRKNLKEILEEWNQSKKYPEETLSSLYTLYFSRELDKTLRAAKVLGIKYIIITESMKHGLVWKYPNEGLLFLLRNKEIFKIKKLAPALELIEIKAPQ